MTSFSDADASGAEREARGTARFRAVRALGALAALALLVMMGHVVANVALRFFLRAPISGTVEVVAYWYLPVIAFTGFVWAQARGGHVESELIFNLLPARLQHELHVLGAALAVVICGGFVWHSGLEAAHLAAIGATATASTLPIWPVTLLSPLAFLALGGMKVGRIVEELRARAASPVVRRAWPGRGLAAAAIGAALAAMVFAPDKATVAVGAIVLLLVLLFLKVPVAFALSGCGLLGLWLIRPRSVVTELESAAYHAVSNWSLSVIPMFVFMGLLLWRSGMTARIYEVAAEWLRWLPGGLAVSTTVAGTGLAAVSGSTLGTTYALARIGVPEMIRAGYDRRVAVGSVIVAGLPGQLIPPSTLLVIYAGIAEVPIGPQLLAGVIPGLMVSGVFVAALAALALARPRLFGSGEQPEARPLAARLRLLASVWPVPALIVAIIGGMYSGVMTATEVGAVGVLGALLLTIGTQGRHAWSAICEAALETVTVTGAIFLLLIGAEMLTDLLALSGLTRGFNAWVAGAQMGRVELLLLIFAAYLVMGMFMEPLPIMILTVPLLVPPLAEMGVSPLWFGVFVVLSAELAMLTPPVGILSFIVHGIVRDPAVNLGREISLKDIFAAVACFMPIAILAGILLIAFPWMATWLPGSM